MPLFLESLTETENKEGEVPRKTHGIAGLRKRDMDTEQAKSTENHVVEMFPPEYEPKTQLTLISEGSHSALQPGSRLSTRGDSSLPPGDI